VLNSGFGESMKCESDVVSYIRRYERYIDSWKSNIKSRVSYPGIDYAATLFIELLSCYHKLRLDIDAGDISEDSRARLHDKLSEISPETDYKKFIAHINTFYFSADKQRSLHSKLSRQYKSFVEKKNSYVEAKLGKKSKVERPRKVVSNGADLRRDSMKKMGACEMSCVLPLAFGLVSLSFFPLYHFFSKTTLPMLSKLGAGKVLGGLGIGLLGWHLTVAVGSLLLLYGVYNMLSPSKISCKKDKHSSEDNPFVNAL
jgi:hypothetical protein